MVEHLRTDALGARWADELARWGIPDAILARAPESPWFHEPSAFALDDALPVDTPSYEFAREALGTGGTVLDVGVGGGRSSLGLGPAASHVTGVDTSAAMLDRFVQSAAAAGISHAAILGEWPEAAVSTDRADVVVCHHVLYNVRAIVPFIRALTGASRRRVVVELTDRHPLARLNEAWQHFHGLRRHDGPVATDVVAVVESLGVHALVAAHERTFTSAARGVGGDVPFVRRALCLPASDDGAVATFLEEHPLPAIRRVVTIAWEGSG